MRASDETERQYWLWVTRPEYYLDEDGNEREDLDPSHGVDTEGWWTCHKDTQEGDLVFLWRTTPKRDIGYLIQAASDAYSIADDPHAFQQGWEYGCDFQVLHKFANPVNIRDLHEDPYLDDWAPLRARFRSRGGYFRIQVDDWLRLNHLASQKDPSYREFAEGSRGHPRSRRIRIETQLEDALAQDLGLLKPFGYDLELYEDPNTGMTGRQFVCKGNGGRIDLLCYDRQHRRYTVVELKNVRASQNTFGQICNYIGWVQDRIAGRTPVVGLVISRGYDVKFESSLRVTDRVSQLDLREVGFQ
jgi:EVE domain